MPRDDDRCAPIFWLFVVPAILLGLGINGYIYALDEMEPYASFSNDFDIDGACTMNKSETIVYMQNNGLWQMHIGSITVRSDKSRFYGVVPFYYPDRRIAKKSNPTELGGLANYMYQVGEFDCVCNKQFATMPSGPTSEYKKGKDHLDGATFLILLVSIYAALFGSLCICALIKNCRERMTRHAEQARNTEHDRTVSQLEAQNAAQNNSSNSQSTEQNAEQQTGDPEDQVEMYRMQITTNDYSKLEEVPE